MTNSTRSYCSFRRTIIFTTRGSFSSVIKERRLPSTKKRKGGTGINDNLQ